MKLSIDDREIIVKEGTTLLDVAQENDFYIPHLCSHPELSPYGGCRLCIVEILGFRGYPTACTTLVQPGMKVRTNTKIVQEMRKEILQLILSEHPSGCLICEEALECGKTMDTIRKVGVTTGCRWCPKDGDCELQSVVRHLEIDSIKFPVYYQDLDVERCDPFFDRDYNLCIYCVRCVRICDEQRMSYVLGLHERGKDALVGPAFHLNHIEASCEFCGACVSVCPTGALAEKNRKWAGVPDEYLESLCPLCSLHCSIQMAVKNGKIIGVLPSGDPHQSGGELCVQGRFCLGETVNHPERLSEPGYRFPQGYGVLTWEEAVQKGARHLLATRGERTAFYLSPNLTSEEMIAVGRFAGEVMETPYITSSQLDENTLHYFSLAEKSIPLEQVEKATAIVTFFFQGNYEYAPLTLAMKRAARAGVPLCRVGWTSDTLSRFASLEFPPPRGKEKDFFRKLVLLMESGKGGSRELKQLVKIIGDGSRPLIVIGPQVAGLTGGVEIMNLLEKFAALAGAGIFAPLPMGNLRGLLANIDIQPVERVNRRVAEKKIDLLYILGDAPFKDRPPVDFIIYQGSYPPSGQWTADLVLPAPTWGETSGTYASKRHGALRFSAAVQPWQGVPGNIHTLARIATAMGVKENLFQEKEISRLLTKKTVAHIPPAHKAKRSKRIEPPGTDSPFLLVREEEPRGFHSESLSRISSGMAELRPGDTIVLHPVDAEQLGLKNDDTVTLTSSQIRKDYPVKVRQYPIPGVVFLYTQTGDRPFETNPCAVNLRRTHV